MIVCLSPNKKIPVFRVTRLYLNLLVKPRFFSGFLSKCIKLYFFPEKKLLKKKICVPTLLKLSDPVTRNTLIFLFGLINHTIGTW